MFKYLREPIGSLVFENPCSRLRGKLTNPESQRAEKGDNKLGSYQVREWLRRAIMCVRIWKVLGQTKREGLVMTNTGQTGKKPLPRTALLERVDQGC